jgi:uncharacterized protein (DUF58 family)
MSVRRTFWAILALLAVTALLGYFLESAIFPIPTPLSGKTDIRILTRMAMIFLGLLAIGWVWAGISLTALNFRREARVLRQQVGQIFEERYRIFNRLPISRLWLEVRDESGLPGNAGSRVLSLIGARQQRSYVAYTLLNQRGVFRLGPTVLSSGDPFGLFLKTRMVPGEAELLVLPYIAQLERFPSPSGQFPGGKAILQKATEVTPQSAGVREYIPGDALRSIHWPTSARKERLMVKEYEQDPQAEVWIFLDADRTVHLNTGVVPPLPRIDQLWFKHNERPFQLPQDSFEYGISAAGSIAAYFLREGRSVGFACVSEAAVVIPAERGERQMNKILENLTFLKPDGRLPIFGLVETESPQLPSASTVVLITPSLYPSVELAVDSLTMRRMRPVMVCLEPQSFGGEQPSEAFLQRLKNRGIPLVLVRNEVPLTESLQTLF